MLACGGFWQFTAFLYRNFPAENPPTKTVAPAPTVDKEERARQRVALFRSLFRGREDVYARRWENADGRHGYMPAVVKDWKAINKSRPEDRNKVDQKTRKFLPLTDAVIEDHLLWPSTQVGGLLAMLPSVDPVAAPESFRRSLIAYLDQVTGGNVLALAQHIRCSHSVLQDWLDGLRVPRLENLLRTCRFLNFPAAGLFAPSGPTSAHIVAAKEAFARTGNRAVLPYRNASVLREALLAALDESAPRTLSEIARSLGYTNTDRLYQADRWWRKPE